MTELPQFMALRSTLAGFTWKRQPMDGGAALRLTVAHLQTITLQLRDGGLLGVCDLCGRTFPRLTITDPASNDRTWDGTLSIMRRRVCSHCVADALEGIDQDAPDQMAGAINWLLAQVVAIDGGAWNTSDARLVGPAWAAWREARGRMFELAPDLYQWWLDLRARCIELERDPGCVLAGFYRERVRTLRPEHRAP